MFGGCRHSGFTTVCSSMCCLCCVWVVIASALSTTGNLVPGVEVDDMGTKSVGNDLDNAWIKFDHVELPYSALLNRFAEIDAEGDGSYRLRVPGVRPFDMIGQVMNNSRLSSSSFISLSLWPHRIVFGHAHSLLMHPNACSVSSAAEWQWRKQPSRIGSLSMPQQR